MARIFITGSAHGLGRLAAKVLISQGHKVMLHTRNASRGREALANVPGSETVFTGDLSSIEATKQLGEQVNNSGPFDAVSISYSNSKLHVLMLALAVARLFEDRPERLCHPFWLESQPGSRAFEDMSVHFL